MIREITTKKKFEEAKAKNDNEKSGIVRGPPWAMRTVKIPKQT